jgi:hypothetical protein
MGQDVRTIRAHPQGLEGKKISGRSRSVFLDFPFYGIYQDVATHFIDVFSRGCISDLFRLAFF